MLTLQAIPAFSDNYIWLLQDSPARRCAVVDPGDAAPVSAWLQQHPDWQLTEILITHHHQDHIGGALQLKQATGARISSPAHPDMPWADQCLAGDQQLDILGQPVRVLAVPGHTLEHLAYFMEIQPAPVLFSGDTLFAAGCGRLFEGRPEQMLDSLRQLAALPADTQVYCAHEYTLGNLHFALAVEPDNPDIRQRLAEVTRLRQAGRISLPSSLSAERATNPFLRCQQASVRQAARVRGAAGNASETEIFTTLRAWKDHF